MLHFQSMKGAPTTNCHLTDVQDYYLNQKLQRKDQLRYTEMLLL